MMTAKYLCSLLCLLVLIGCGETPEPEPPNKGPKVSLLFYINAGKEMFWSHRADSDRYITDGKLHNNVLNSQFFVVRVRGGKTHYIHADDFSWREDGSIEFVDCGTNARMVMSSGTPFTVEEHRGWLDPEFLQNTNESGGIELDTAL